MRVGSKIIFMVVLISSRCQTKETTFEEYSHVADDRRVSLLQECAPLKTWSDRFIGVSPNFTFVDTSLW